MSRIGAMGLQMPSASSTDLLQVREEVKELARIAGPVTVANLLVYLRSMVSVFCLGRLGELELAGGALSIGLTNITGYSILFGLATGMDPVCSQAFGSRNWSLVGLALQRTILILLCACIPISLLWVNLDGILLTLGQDAQISAVASTFCMFSLPDLAVNCILQPLRVYLRSQGITAPMMWCSFLAILIHLPLNFVLVFVLKLGVPGVAIASVWTNLNMVLFLLTYLWFSGVYKRTWVPWSLNCLNDWRPILKLALPSCCGICLEWWWYEIITVMAGYLPDPQTAVSATAIIIQTTSLMYTFPLALCSSVCTRVGIELGANRPTRARLAAFVALTFAMIFALVNITWTSAFPGQWAGVFSADKKVLSLAATAVPLIGLCELGNCPQTTGCGVLRGCARPSAAARINFGSFYAVGMPVAYAMAFSCKVGFQGLWYGLLAAQIVCAIWVLLALFRTDWTFEALRAKQLTAKADDFSNLEPFEQPLVTLAIIVDDAKGEDNPLDDKPTQMRV